MAKPNSRQTFLDYCLRSLGAPVIEINVDEDQLDDRVDEALQFYQFYHADSIEKFYLKTSYLLKHNNTRFLYFVLLNLYKEFLNRSTFQALV